MPSYSPIFSTTGSTGARGGGRYVPPASFTTPDYSKLNPAGNWPGSAQGKPDPATLSSGKLPTDYPVLDSGTGTYVNIRTKEPWTGKMQDGSYAVQGKPGRDPSLSGSSSIDPNNPAQRYAPVDIVKSPAVSSATQSLMDEFRKGADQTLSGFNDYLSQFKSAASDAISRQKAANDVTGTTATLQGAQNRYSSDIASNRQAYANSNANANAAESGIVQAANDQLPGYNAAMDTARGIAEQQATNAVSRYGAGKNASAGAPLGMGGDVAAITAQKAFEAAQPYELAKVNRGFQNLSDYNLPVARDIASREAVRLGQFEPAMAGADFSSTQGTANTIQSLKQAAARGDWTTAQQIMQIPAVAAQVRQAALQGDTSLLGALGQLEDQSRYRGLQDRLGINTTQPMAFGGGGGAFPSPDGGSRYSPNGNPSLGPNAPRDVSPAGVAGADNYGAPNGQPAGASPVDQAYYSQTGQWPHQDPNFSQAMYDRLQAQYNYSGRQGMPGSNSRGSQSNSVYDPIRNAYVDRTTGEVTGWGPSGPNHYGQDGAPGDYETNPALAGLV